MQCIVYSALNLMHSSFGIEVRLQAGRPKNRCFIRKKGLMVLPFCTEPRLAVGLTQHLNQWEAEALPPGAIFLKPNEANHLYLRCVCYV
jgi:hypothetical protein